MNGSSLNAQNVLRATDLVSGPSPHIRPISGPQYHRSTGLGTASLGENYANSGPPAVPALDGNSTMAGIWHQLGTVALEVACPEVAFGCFHRHLSTHPYDILALMLVAAACTRYESLHELMDWNEVVDRQSIGGGAVGDSGVLSYENCRWVTSLLHQYLEAISSTASTSADVSSRDIAVRLVWCKLQYALNQYAAVVAQVDEILALGLDDVVVDLVRQELIYLKCLNLIKLGQYHEAQLLASQLRPATAAATTNYHRMMVKIFYAEQDYCGVHRHLAVLSTHGAPRVALFNYRYRILMAYRESHHELAAALCHTAVVLFPADYQLLVLHCYSAAVHTAAAAATATTTAIATATTALESLFSVLAHVLHHFPQAPYDFVPFYLQGWAYLLAGHHGDAYLLLQHCLACTSKISIVWIMVARLYLELGQLPDALSAYSQAIRLAGDDSVDAALAWDGLGCVYARSQGQAGDAADARAMAVKCFRTAGWQQYAEQYGQGDTDRTVPVEVPLLVVLRYVEMDVADRLKLCENVS